MEEPRQSPRRPCRDASRPRPDSGLPVTRGSRSWATWLLGILGFGTLYLFGEGAAGWIDGRDNVADPHSKRALNLVLLLALVLVFCAAAASIVWMAQ